MMSKTTFVFKWHAISLVSLQAYRGNIHPNIKNGHAEMEGVGHKEGNLVIFETAL